MYTPRHLRRGYISRSGPGKEEKSRMFRAAKRLSDQFIHQSASALESPRLNHQYMLYCQKANGGYLRKTK